MRIGRLMPGNASFAPLKRGSRDGSTGVDIQKEASTIFSIKKSQFTREALMDRKGQTTVEFALTALLLFAFLFAIIDLAVMFYVNLTMQHAVREGTRFAITGPPGDRRVLLTEKIREHSYGLYDKNALPQRDPTVSVLTPTSTTGFVNYTGTPIADTGRQKQIIIVSLNYAWPLLTPTLKPFFTDGRYTFTVRATMKNEPWGP
jgi:Flp pilus assembly protein TadG